MNLGLSSNGIGVWDSNIRKGVRGPRTPGQRRARSDCEGWPLYRSIKNSIFCCLTDSFWNIFMPRLLWIAITSGSGEPFVQLANQGVGFIPFSDVFTIQLQTALSINQIFYKEHAIQWRE